MPYATPPLSSQSPQGLAPGAQPSSPAPAPDWAAALTEHSTPLQFFDGLARHGFGLVSRLLTAVSGMVTRYPRHWRTLLACSTGLLRVLLTVRFAPEHITLAQLRRLSRARQLIESLLGRPLPFLHPQPAPSATANQQPSASPENATPLGPRTSSSANPTAHQSPSASPLGPRTSPSANPTAHQSPSASPLGPRTSSSATTPSPAIPSAPSPNSSPATPPVVRTPAIRQVPEVPLVAGISPVPASPTVASGHLTPDPSHPSHPSHLSHTSHPSHPSQTPQSDLLPPFIPDLKTLHQALNSATLPPNCAGALLDEPADTLVRALRQLHAVYFSFYPNQPPTPAQSPSSSPSQSQSPFNLQSSIYNPQSGNLQSDAPSVHPVHSVHSPSPAQSEISNLKSDIPNPDSASPHSAFPIPHSTAPP